MIRIPNSHQFYHDLQKAKERRDNDAFKTPRQKKIEKLEQQLKAASETNQRIKKNLKETQELVERLKEENKNLKYDNANLKEELYLRKVNQRQQQHSNQLPGSKP